MPPERRWIPLLRIPDDVQDAGRKEVHANKIKFTDWLKSVGGAADTGMTALIGTTPIATVL